MWLNIIFITSILNRYINNLSLKYFQTLKKLYKYLLETRLTLKYTEVPGVYIILKILLDNNIYLNTYSDLNWGGDKDNYYSIINYFFEIAGRIIS